MVQYKDINWDAIFDKIQAAKIPDWDKETVAAAVTKAVETWYRGDAENEIVTTELYGSSPFPHKIDLLMQKDGRYIVADWKSKRSGKLDEKWEFRESRSWQAKIYAAAVATRYGRDVFPIRYEIRGVTLDEKPVVKTIAMEINLDLAARAVRYLRAVTAMRDALVEIGKTPWVKNPSGCQMFGPAYKCEFEDVCWSGASAVETPVDLQRPMSHSQAQEFLRCPERYRLLKVATWDAEEEVAAAGNLFHEVMEMIYRG